MGLSCGVWRLGGGDESAWQRLGLAPRKREKQGVTEVSRWPKFWFGTPEEGKASSLWGELLLLVVELHPGRRGKQVVSGVSCHYIIEK